MANVSEVAGTSGENVPAEPAVTIKALADLVAGMSRFLTRLQDVHVFKAANLGLAEWLALSTIASSEGMNNKLLAKGLGISAQRAGQIGDALRKSGLISVVATGDESRRNVMKPTETGNAKLKELEASLWPLILQGMKGKERNLLRINKGVRGLLRVLPAPEPPKKNPKKSN
jgi:DNA-binding MarR family transcriptional regulator